MRIHRHRYDRQSAKIVRANIIARGRIKFSDRLPLYLELLFPPLELESPSISDENAQRDSKMASGLRTQSPLERTARCFHLQPQRCPRARPQMLLPVTVLKGLAAFVYEGLVKRVSKWSGTSLCSRRRERGGSSPREARTRFYLAVESDTGEFNRKITPRKTSLGKLRGGVGHGDVPRRRISRLGEMQMAQLC